jgi:branched-subunit amino acid transport protein
METLYLISGMFLVTFGVRYILLPLAGRFTFSGAMQRALRYVPPAVLTAIIVPAALIPDGKNLQCSLDNAYLAGTVATVIIGKLSKNLLLTIVGGMVCFALWQWLVPGP